jgi:hypothetical protein
MHDVQLHGQLPVSVRVSVSMGDHALGTCTRLSSLKELDAGGDAAQMQPSFCIWHSSFFLAL